jgi:hypothetical protein
MKSAQTEVLDIAYEESGPADARPVIRIPALLKPSSTWRDVKLTPDLLHIDTSTARRTRFDG